MKKIALISVLSIMSLVLSAQTINDLGKAFEIVSGTQRSYINKSVILKVERRGNNTILFTDVDEAMGTKERFFLDYRTTNGGFASNNALYEWVRDRMYGVIEVLKNTTNEVADSSYVVWNLEGYNSFELTIAVAGGVTMTAYATLNPDASDTNETEWYDFANTLFITADNLVDGKIFVYQSSFMPAKIMLKFVNSDDINSAYVAGRKRYSD